jgi:hypothetical protein
VTTRTWVGIVVGMAFCLSSPTAFAATYFKYRDLGTGCDVLVNQADQIPRKCRDGARIVTEGAVGTTKAAFESCRKNSEHRIGPGCEAMTGESQLGNHTIDAKLARNGGRYLTENELEDLKRLYSTGVSAYVLAVLAALVAWIAVMVAAFREDHLGWAMLMLFLSAPMALVYLFLGLGKGHGRFKAVCALGMLSPLLVFLAHVWRVFGAATG